LVEAVAIIVDQGTASASEVVFLDNNNFETSLGESRSG